ncbi:MAG: PilZ domain-containing protein [Candidatus Krumholzibacteriia bacterium]
MVAETLQALAETAARSLREANLPPRAVRVSSLRARDLNFPLAARLDIRNGTTHQLWIGGDRTLAGTLQARGEGAFAEFCQSFLGTLVPRLPTRRPFGEVHVETGGPGIVATRGVRSYVLRLDGDAGSLFVVADVISRAEYEAMRGSNFEEGAADAYLPAAIMGEGGERAAGGDGLLVYLRKLEVDVQIQVPVEGGVQLHNGIVIGRGDVDGNKGFVVAMDLPAADETPLQPGSEVHVHTGVRGKYLAFNTTYLGKLCRTLGAGAALTCPVFAVPAEVRSAQRRSAFRVETTTRIVAELERVERDPEGGEPAAGPSILAQVQDLSFTGARLGGAEGSLRPYFATGDLVRCRMVFPGLERLTAVDAVIRRVDTVPADRNERQDVMGIEFQVTSAASRHHLEFIREYVLSEQRALLARRVHVLP